MRNNLILFTIFILLNSCGVFGEAGKVLRNEKITTTDEFLVKKKEPLVMPPNHSELPKPGSMKSRDLEKTNKIKSLLKKEKTTQEGNQKKNSSLENIILNEIKK